jgi:hypothetical protein
VHDDISVLRYIFSQKLGKHLCCQYNNLLMTPYSCVVSVLAARPARYTYPTFASTDVNITVFKGVDAVPPCAVYNLGPKLVSTVYNYQVIIYTFSLITFSYNLGPKLVSKQLSNNSTCIHLFSN